MQHLTTICFALVGLINLAPLIGVLSTGRLAKLYDVTIHNADLALLMRHRAVLFGIVGSLLLAASVSPQYRGLAAIAGFASMLSYIGLAFALQVTNPKLVQIAWVDVVGCVLLAIGVVLHYQDLRSTL